MEILLWEYYNLLVCFPLLSMFCVKNFSLQYEENKEIANKGNVSTVNYIQRKKKKKKAFATPVSTVTATVFFEVHADFNFLFWAGSFNAQNIHNSHLNSKFEKLMFVASIPLVPPLRYWSFTAHPWS